MTAPSLQPRRSFIFAPGIQPEMFPKALKTGADIVCVDLEDAIAPEHKDAAREKTMALFAEPQADDGVERVVRVNSLRTADGQRDILAILESPSPPPVIMLPKVKSPDEIRLLDELLIGPAAAVRFHVIIETNEGLAACHEIARAAERVSALFFGGVDMAAELRVEPTWTALSYGRSRAVHAAASAGIDMIDVPYLDLNDMEGMAREARAAADLGFTGKGSIHPKQIPVLNQIFTPDAAAVARARQIIKAFAESDSGLLVVDGVLIEKPVLRSMHRILAIADRIAE